MAAAAPQPETAAGPLARSATERWAGGEGGGGSGGVPPTAPLSGSSPFWEEGGRAAAFCFAGLGAGLGSGAAAGLLAVVPGRTLSSCSFEGLSAQMLPDLLASASRGRCTLPLSRAPRVLLLFLSLVSAKVTSGT